MSKSINILDKDYVQWIKELSSLYRRSQIKAAVKVNQEVLKFYWELGRDIVERNANSSLLIDFEGSAIESIRNFYEGFGAKNEPYPMLEKNMWVAKILGK